MRHEPASTSRGGTIPQQKELWTAIPWKELILYEELDHLVEVRFP